MIHTFFIIYMLNICKHYSKVIGTQQVPLVYLYIPSLRDYKEAALLIIDFTLH